jgi:hypothetical protein
LYLEGVNCDLCTLKGVGGMRSLKTQPCRLLLNQYERYNLIRTVQTSNTHVNKAVHYAQVLNSQCQEDIAKNNKAWLTEYHYCTGTTTVAPGYALYIYNKDN